MAFHDFTPRDHRDRDDRQRARTDASTRAALIAEDQATRERLIAAGLIVPAGTFDPRSIERHRSALRR